MIVLPVLMNMTIWISLLNIENLDSVLLLHFNLSLIQYSRYSQDFYWLSAAHYWYKSSIKALSTSHLQSC